MNLRERLDRLVAIESAKPGKRKRRSREAMAAEMLTYDDRIERVYVNGVDNDCEEPGYEVFLHEGFHWRADACDARLFSSARELREDCRGDAIVTVES